ncbi:GntR family transcriptional regulator [Microbacterium aurantiacum]|uniref:GntR family transcriptional regulator n=1 Tax=Microbacterium aurantiacum TaxID=162393 RepID=A0ABT8FW82_9MICO|nr:GntR family transcriptional regulator [Microbacterium aurantiacum]MDN4465456.1 GntR family transcriptional regulator [Microbacterium aurantiacum]
MVARVTVVSVIEAVAGDLRARILAGDIAPGDALGEVEVAATYDVARPTAKAAIEELVRARLLERKAHKTARVVRLSPDDARDIYRARALVEAGVVRTLAQQRWVPDAARAANLEIATLDKASLRDVVEPDMRFHRSLVDAVGSMRTSRIYETLTSEVVFCMSQVQGAALLPTALIVHEHERILALVEAGDGEAAAELLEVHIGRARERLVERLGGAAGVEAALP